MASVDLNSSLKIFMENSSLFSVTSTGFTYSNEVIDTLGFNSFFIINMSEIFVIGNGVLEYKFIIQSSEDGISFSNIDESDYSSGEEYRSVYLDSTINSLIYTQVGYVGKERYIRSGLDVAIYENIDDMKSLSISVGSNSLESIRL